MNFVSVPLFSLPRYEITLSGIREKKLVCRDENSFCFLRRTHGVLLLPLGGRKGTLQLEGALFVGERLNQK